MNITIDSVTYGRLRAMSTLSDVETIAQLLDLYEQIQSEKEDKDD